MGVGDGRRRAEIRHDRVAPGRGPHLSAASGVHRRRACQRPGDLRRGRRRLRGVLGEAGRGAPRLDRAVAHGARMGPPVRQVVRGRQAQRHLQLPRPSCGRGPGRQGRVPLGRRAGRHPDHHLRRAAARCVPARQRAQGARRREGRPRQHLPGHGPRAADRDARVRAHRGTALGRLRRLFLRRPA